MNKLKDGMIFFHGSYTPVEKIELDMCSNAKDFGKGFYLTSDENQAKGFIKTSIRKAVFAGDILTGQNYGFVSAFRFNMPLNNKECVQVYEFATTDREWLWFIAQNRRERLAAQLKPMIDPIIFDAEVIIGKVANDKTNATIMAYLAGLYGEVNTEEAANDAIKRLLPDKLEDQFCFLTEKAIKCLEFQGARKYVI